MPAAMGQLELIGEKFTMSNGPVREFFPAAVTSAIGPPDNLGSNVYNTQWAHATDCTREKHAAVGQLGFIGTKLPIRYRPIQ